MTKTYTVAIAAVALMGSAVAVGSASAGRGEPVALPPVAVDIPLSDRVLACPGGLAGPNTLATLLNEQAVAQSAAERQAAQQTDTARQQGTANEGASGSDAGDAGAGANAPAPPRAVDPSTSVNAAWPATNIIPLGPEDDGDGAAGGGGATDGQAPGNTQPGTTQPGGQQPAVKPQPRSQTSQAAMPDFQTWVSADIRAGQAAKTAHINVESGVDTEEDTLNAAELVQSVELESGTTANASALVVPSAGNQPAPAGGLTLATRGKGPLAGIAAGACVDATTESWLIGGGTAAGMTATLEIVNPLLTPATISVQVYSDIEALRPSSLQEILIPPRSAHTQSLGEVAGGIEPLAVRVAASSGKVASWLMTTRTEGPASHGFDIISRAAPPAAHQVIPFVERAAATDAAARFPESVVRLVNPGTQTVSVSWKAVSDTGGTVSFDNLRSEVPAGSSLDVQLPANFPLGMSALSLTADGPFTAAARSVMATGETESVREDPSNPFEVVEQAQATADIAWVGATEPLGQTSSTAGLAVRPQSGGLISDVRLVHQPGGGAETASATHQPGAHEEATAPHDAASDAADDAVPTPDPIPKDEVSEDPSASPAEARVTAMGKPTEVVQIENIVSLPAGKEPLAFHALNAHTYAVAVYRSSKGFAVIPMTTGPATGRTVDVYTR